MIAAVIYEEFPLRLCINVTSNFLNCSSQLQESSTNIHRSKIQTRVKSLQFKTSFQQFYSLFHDGGQRGKWRGHWSTLEARLPHTKQNIQTTSLTFFSTHTHISIILQCCHHYPFKFHLWTIHCFSLREQHSNIQGLNDLQPNPDFLTFRKRIFVQLGYTEKRASNT